MTERTPEYGPTLDHTLAADALRGRVIAITGATNGLGRALALAAAAHGAELILLGRSGAKLEALHAELSAAGHPSTAATAAVFDLEKALANDYDALTAAMQARYGRLDGLVHTAAVLGTLAPIEQYDVPTWCRVLHVNLTAAFALTQVLLPLLRASADASLIYSTCEVGRRGEAYWGAYGVAKFALEGLSQTLAAELANVSTVRVNTVNPGPMRTATRRNAFPYEDTGALPLPAACVEPYLWLLSGASRGITGRTFDAAPPERYQEKEKPS
jgi:NAD(P)-dependent dehydrogenase (short-subunit alcohol dehydrogenase family)